MVITMLSTLSDTEHTSFVPKLPMFESKSTYSAQIIFTVNTLLDGTRMPSFRAEQDIMLI